MARRDQRSAEATKYRHLYSTARWANTRDRQLRAHPLCQRCEAAGFIVEATVCNHVDPASKLNPATFFAGPFSSLCSPCHDQAVQSDERTGRTTTRPGYTGRVNQDGWPSDPRHPANAQR